MSKSIDEVEGELAELPPKFTSLTPTIPVERTNTIPPVKIDGETDPRFLRLRLLLVHYYSQTLLDQLAAFDARIVLPTHIRSRMQHLRTILNEVVSIDTE